MLNLAKTINPKSKILIICPHPDDEVLGCCSILHRYSSQCDVLCVNSSGFQEPYEQCADTRIREFNDVMDAFGIKNHWIWRIFGPAPNLDQIKANFDEYKSVTDFSQYSHIFIPSVYDSHVEHRYIADTLVPELLCDNNNPDTIICEYMVWGKTKVRPNAKIFVCPFVKRRALKIYASRNQKVLKDLSGLNLPFPRMYEYFIVNNIKH